MKFSPTSLAAIFSVLALAPLLQHCKERIAVAETKAERGSAQGAAAGEQGWDLRCDLRDLASTKKNIAGTTSFAEAKTIVFSFPERSSKADAAIRILNGRNETLDQWTMKEGLDLYNRRMDLATVSAAIYGPQPNYQFFRSLKAYFHVTGADAQGGKNYCGDADLNDDSVCTISVVEAGKNGGPNVAFLKKLHCENGAVY